MPHNELNSQIELVYNQEVCGIISAFWTKKMPGDIKFDMQRDVENGVTRLEDFLGQTISMRDASNYAAIDLTVEVQETFNMYQNLYGNKVLDFNDNSSPF